MASTASTELLGLTKTPIVIKPTTKTPIVIKPTIKAPVIKAPTIKAPVINPPTIKAPTIKAPVIKAPVINPPTIKAPVIKAPVTKVPVINPPTIKAPVIKAPVTKVPVIKSTTTQALTTTTQPGIKETTQTQQQVTVAEAMALFKEFDVDNRGKLNADKLSALLAKAEKRFPAIHERVKRFESRREMARARRAGSTSTTTQLSFVGGATVDIDTALDAVADGSMEYTIEEFITLLLSIANTVTPSYLYTYDEMAPGAGALTTQQTTPILTPEGSYLIGLQNMPDNILKGSDENTLTSVATYGTTWTTTGTASSVWEHSGKAIWNGSYWFTLVVDNPHTSNKLSELYKSSDGNNWTLVTPSGGLFYCISWNGSYWLALRGINISKSTDGITWSDSPAPDYTPESIGTSLSLVWNGSYWLYASPYALYTSTDGTNWTKKVTTPTQDGGYMSFSISWNGSYWLLMTYGQLYKTYNCVDLYRIKDITIGYRNEPGANICWNGTYWLVSSESEEVTSGNGGGLAYSIDGEKWKFIFAFDGGLNCLAWYKNHWIGYGRHSTMGNNQCMGKSTDGIIWTYTASTNDPNTNIVYLAIGGAPETQTNLHTITVGGRRTRKRPSYEKKRSSRKKCYLKKK